MAKYEIEIPNLPEGVRPVGLKEESEAVVDRYGNIVHATYASGPHLPVVVLEGFELIRQVYDNGLLSTSFTVRRKPRLRVRIEFDEPEGFKEAFAVSYWDKQQALCTNNRLSVTILEGE